MVAELLQAYRDMTDAFLAFPICFPGTAVWRGRQVGSLPHCAPPACALPACLRSACPRLPFLYSSNLFLQVSRCCPDARPPLQARFYLFKVLEGASHRALEHIKVGARLGVGWLGSEAASWLSALLAPAASACRVAQWASLAGSIPNSTVLRVCLQRGGEPRCLMDFWAQKCLEEIAEAEAEGRAPPAHTTPDRMGDAMLDFLFASQDASTASLVWSLVFMTEHPDVLAKVGAALPAAGVGWAPAVFLHLHRRTPAAKARLHVVCWQAGRACGEGWPAIGLPAALPPGSCWPGL